MRVFVFALLLVVALAKNPKVIGTRTVENIPSTWTLLSDAEETKEVPFIVALHQRNLEKLEEIFWDVSNPDSPNYRNFMEIEEITALVAPPVHHAKKVMRWLVNGGAEILENRGDSIYAKATVATASELFSTTFKVFQHESGKQIIRQFGDFSVPHHLANHVDFVAGLSEFPIGKFKAIKQKGYFNPDVAVTVCPQTIQIMYGTANAEVHGNSSAGVIEFEDQYYSPSDLSQFATQFNVKIPALTPNHIVGSNQPSNPQIEATLDIQYILGVATDAKGWFWIEADPIWLYGFATHMFGRKDVPLVNSISYGWNEEAQCQDGIGGAECQQLGLDNTQYVKRINIEFQKIGIRGITIFTASGDSGANGRTDYYCTEDHLNPVFPGASPYVTSVGATQISDASGKANLPNPPPGCSGMSCASGGTEQAVSFDQAHFASGGGFSFIAPAPAHQKAAIADYFKSGVPLPPSSYYNAQGRGFPDVSAFGSQVLILTNGSIEPVGGTSASSPIFAGVVSLLNDYVNTKTGKPLGHVAPLLYKIAAADPNCFNDITVGDNICTEAGCSASCKGFTCAKGWDPVSGLGTPHYPCLLNYLKAHVVKETN